MSPNRLTTALRVLQRTLQSNRHLTRSQPTIETTAICTVKYVDHIVSIEAPARCGAECQVPKVAWRGFSQRGSCYELKTEMRTEMNRFKRTHAPSSLRCKISVFQALLPSAMTLTGGFVLSGVQTVRLPVHRCDDIHRQFDI